MKSYDETINTVFDRIGEYKTAQKRKKKIITRTLLPVCSVVLITVIGICVWQSGILKSEPPVTLEDSTVIGEKDYIEPDELDNSQEEQISSSSYNSTSQTDDTQPDIMQIPGENDMVDIIGSVKVDGIQYLQCSTDATLFTADKYLGDAKDFEGSYKQFSNDFNSMANELYTVKESSNVMMIKLGNGGTVILGRVGEIIVDGKTYFSTQWVKNEFTVDKYLGKAEDFELIEVPYRESFIVPEDEIWTVQENSNILFIKKDNGDILVYSIWE
ncbi:MAG: hypothetical protein IJY79_03280 [Clostridia bacterium]|nr:hypothetical protein [Clostridia bacterium]